MLGTALNVVSVGGGVGVAVLLGLVLTPGLAWPLGGFFAAGAYVFLEAVELAIAGRLVDRRGRAADE